MPKNRYRLFIPLALLSVLLVFAIGKGLHSPDQKEISPRESQILLQRVMDLIKSSYIEIPDADKTMEGAFRGLVGSLDILSSYLDKASFAKFSNLGREASPEVGLILYKRHGTFPMVIGIREGSPAASQDIKIGDVITAMDGQTTHMMSMTESNLYLKDPGGGSVKLKIVRQEDNLEAVVERAQPASRIFGYTSSLGTSGILKVHRLFSPGVEEMRSFLISRLKNRTHPLVIDLRNCSEGAIGEARKFISLFVQEKHIGRFEGRGEDVEFSTSSEDAPFEDVSLLIWTNNATLGPAEIVAGVLQTERQARVIGQQTPGLVALQKTLVLDDGTALLLTSSVFRLSSGKKIWLKGVEPDVKIKELDAGTAAYLTATQKLLSDS